MEREWSYWFKYPYKIMKYWRKRKFHQKLRIPRHGYKIYRKLACTTRVGSCVKFVIAGAGLYVEIGILSILLVIIITDQVKPDNNILVEVGDIVDKIQT